MSSSTQSQGKEYDVDEDASGTMRDRAQGERVVRVDRAGIATPRVIVGLPPGGWRRALFLWGLAPVPFFRAFDGGGEGASE